MDKVVVVLCLLSQGYYDLLLKADQSDIDTGLRRFENVSFGFIETTQILEK
jgi:hypothetical protein